MPPPAAPHHQQCSDWKTAYIQKYMTTSSAIHKARVIFLSSPLPLPPSLPSPFFFISDIGAPLNNTRCCVRKSPSSYPPTVSPLPLSSLPSSLPPSPSLPPSLPLPLSLSLSLSLLLPPPPFLSLYRNWHIIMDFLLC